MKTKSVATRVFWWLMLVTLVLLGLHLLFQYLNLEIYQEKHGQVFELSNRLDFDDEVSLPTWFSQFVLLIGGVAGLFVSYLETKRSAKQAWLFIGLVGVLFSIDEVGSIHEFVLQSGHLLYYGEVVPTAAVNAWWLVLPFIAVGGMAFLYWLYRVVPLRTLLLFAAGGVTYLIGAAIFDLISNHFAKSTYMYQGIMTGAEETLEMIGSTVVLYAILKYLETHHLEKIRAALKQLRANDS